MIYCCTVVAVSGSMFSKRKFCRLSESELKASKIFIIMKKAGTIANKLVRVIEAATVGQSLRRYSLKTQIQ
ncbi:hypothetical protein JPFTNV_16430 [Francisella tularensis subsp. holarctica]|nr:hypothetical protein JPFTNV_16430 [Francisella tularensis subsp. holarctica]BCL54388.1 hypothetical protein JPFTKU_02020 [Francisella tularensis subsp. holarctica]